MREWLWGIVALGFLILGIHSWAPVVAPPDGSAFGACDQIVGYGVIAPSFANGRYRDCREAAWQRRPVAPGTPVSVLAQIAP